VVKVVVIEGRRGATDAIAGRLQAEGHEVFRGGSRDNAKMIIHARDPQVLIVVAVPLHLWHLQLLGDLLTWERTPFSLAVGDAGGDDFPALLNAGADAVCPYPPPPELFEAEMTALGRRATAPTQEPPIPEVVTVRELTIDNARYQASFSGTRLNVTPAEFRILASLARRPGKVVPTDTLSVEALGNSDGGRAARDTLKVHVRRIRNKIRDVGGTPDYIWNIRGVGYMLERRSAGVRDRQMDEDAWDDQTGE
jgi:DNA-binding response OmpR family regulator